MATLGKTITYNSNDIHRSLELTVVMTNATKWRVRIGLFIILCGAKLVGLDTRIEKRKEEQP